MTLVDHEGYAAELAARRENLLSAMLDDVPFDGWSLRALRVAAKRVNLTPEEADLAFPGGLAEIARTWSDLSDQRMLAVLDERDLASMRIRDRVSAAVQARIMVNVAHREALRRLLGWLALPTNAPVALGNAARTVDHMWYAAGDRAADWNYYTKRGLLAPVYTSTVLYWLADEADESGDYPRTWAYLDRRIDDVLKTFGLPRRLKARAERFLGGFRRRASRA